MNRNGFRKLEQAWPIMAATVGLALASLPVAAQHGAGHAGTGGITASRPMPSHSFSTPRYSREQRFSTVRPNPLGASSAPRPSWELPKNIIPHWEIGPNVRIQPNRVQGNRAFHHRSRFGVGYRSRFGVGYVGVPYYVDPFVFGNDWDWDDDSDSAQQEAPAPPAQPEYAPQEEPYAEEAPYDQGYPAARPPYNPEGYPPPQQPSSAQSPAAQNEVQTDGLDHPAITLVFKDGRPPEKVQSYALTGSSIFIAEPGHQRTIPIADLDLPATIEQNREAGIEFQLPGNRK